MVLECGSGFSTLIVALVLRERGSRLVSLEHNPHWARRVRIAARLGGIANCDVLFSPLVEYPDSIVWYSIDRLTALLGPSFIVLCDGPPALNDPTARFGLVPILSQAMVSETVVLLDDINRAGEQEVLARWQSEYDVTVLERVETDEAGYVLLGVPAPGNEYRPPAQATAEERHADVPDPSDRFLPELE